MSSEISAWSRMQKLSIPGKQGNVGSTGKMGQESYSEPLPFNPLNQDKLLKIPLFLSLNLRDLKHMLGFPAVPLLLSLSPPPSLQGDKDFHSTIRDKSLEKQILWGINANKKSFMLKYNQFTNEESLVSQPPTSFSSPFPPQQSHRAAAFLQALKLSPD